MEGDGGTEVGRGEFDRRWRKWSSAMLGVGGGSFFMGQGHSWKRTLTYPVEQLMLGFVILDETHLHFPISL